MVTTAGETLVTRSAYEVCKFAALATGAVAAVEVSARRQLVGLRIDGQEQAP